MHSLIIRERGSDNQWIHACTEDTISIGRLDTNTVQLCTKGVSRQHAKITAEGEKFFVIDLKSGNGTYLNGIALTPHEKALLRKGDTIAIDAYDIVFQLGEGSFRAAYEEDVTESDILEVKLLKKVLTALDKETVPSIEVLNGIAEGKKVFLTDEISEIVIGRDPESAFPINEYVISRRHAKISKKWGGISIRDLESKNGTFINNRRVVEEYLHDGDRIALGTIVLLFRNPQEINFAQLSDIRPKNAPAPVKPSEIPGLEAEGGPPAPEEAPPQEEPPEEEAAPLGEDEELSALEEWDKLEQELSQKAPYPMPTPKAQAIKNLTPMEIGMIGLGSLILIFALITIVNLLAS